MDCCQPQEGSAAPASAGSPAPGTALAVAASTQSAPAAAIAAWTGASGESVEPRVPLHTLHSVFRI